MNIQINSKGGCTKTIFFDFDGVLFDTVLESYLLARYAYFGLEPFETVNKNEYDLFHMVRYLITDSWHYATY